ncbi:MAG: polysaccharide biosynthesis C-terminal domain-containing protein [Candidatus Latescibacteria bacterium]|nr:polysaccharide biosynthesis C-terminal domain-containing protein [Candidatus Latescibacterota bacterium]
MKLLREGAAVLGLRLGQAAAGAGAGLVVARALGPDGQGRYALGITLLMFVAAAVNGGVGLAAVPAIRRRPAAATSLLRSQFFWTGAVTLAIAAAGALAWRSDAGADLAARLGWNATTAMAMVAALAALVLSDILAYDLLALGRLRTGTAVNLGRGLLQLTLLGAALATGVFGLAAALVVFAASQVAGAAVFAWLAARGARHVGDSSLVRKSGGTAKLLKAGWQGQLSAVVSLLHMRLALALVAAWHGTQAVGVYSVAVMIGEVLWLLPSALQPLLVWSSAAGDGEAGVATSARAVRIALAATAAAACLAAIAAPLLLAPVFGERYRPAVPALWALLPGIVACAPGAVLAGDFIGRGRSAWNTQASLVTLAVNAGAGLLLIPRHGPLGAALATSLAYAVGSGVMLIRFRQVASLPWRQLLLPVRGDFSVRS